MNPYLITGTAIINFSMGRTSAYLLKMILDAHGGTLPPDVHVVTENTGLEDERSLRFGHECATRWGFDWHLIEYRDAEPGFERVDMNSASRSGEPFAALIAKKGFVPNRGAPYCSLELKARTCRDYVRATWGWQRWTAITGLRHDEQLRVIGAAGRNVSGKDPWRTVMPLDEAKVVKRDVLRFFGFPDGVQQSAMAPTLPQGFDLGLWGYEGNCPRCWKKTLSKVRRIIRDEQDGLRPPAPQWSEWEGTTNSTFYPELSHADLEQQVRDEPMMPLDEGDDDDGDCGFTCIIADADQMDIAA